jgi:hypothetical protein
LLTTPFFLPHPPLFRAALSAFVLQVRLITRSPEKWQKEITATEHIFLSNTMPFLGTPTKETYTGSLDMIVGWKDAARALEGSDMALLLCPVNMHREILELLVPCLPDHEIAVGTAYAQGGFDWQLREVLKQ